MLTKDFPSSDSFSLQSLVQSLIKFLDYFCVQGSSLTQTKVRVGTCNIFLMIPVLWPRLTTSRVMHSLILGPLLTDIYWFCLMSSMALSTIRLIFWMGLNRLRLSVAYFFYYFFSSFCNIIQYTSFKGYRYFWVSLYSLFSTSLSRFWIMSSLTLPPYFLYGQSSTSFVSAG